MDYIERFMRSKWGYSRYFTVHDFLKGKAPGSTQKNTHGCIFDMLKWAKDDNVYIIGSSVARDSVNCGLLDALFPNYTFFNLGLPCHTARQIAEDYELDLIIAHEPKVVLFPVHPFLMVDEYPDREHFYLEFYEKDWEKWKKKYKWRAIPGLFFPSPGHLHDLKDSRLRQYPWTNQKLDAKLSFNILKQHRALEKIRKRFKKNNILFKSFNVPIRASLGSGLIPMRDKRFFRDDVHPNALGQMLGTMLAAHHLGGMLDAVYN